MALAKSHNLRSHIIRYAMSDVAPMLYDNPSPQQLKISLRSARTPSPPRRHRHTSPATNSGSGSTSKAARLVSAIQLGHTRCLRRHIFDLLEKYSRQKPSSPLAGCSSSILDRRETPPRPDYEWVTARRQLFLENQGSSYATEFEQTSSPLIWAVDCREWSCLRLMCTIQAKDQGKFSNEDSGPFQGAVYNPSQPQPVRRRIICSVSMKYPHLPFTSQNCVCCAPESRPNRSEDFENFVQEDIPVSLRNRLRPLANVMLSVSFSNLCSSTKNCSRSPGQLSPSTPASGRFLHVRTWRSAQSSPKRDRSPANRSPYYTRARETNSVVLIGCINTSKHSSRQWKRATPFRAFWIRGSYTYQSLLDYFFATGYESVGTHFIADQSIQTDCEHCKQDVDYEDCPNYPTGSLDPRNEIFYDHFSQMERFLQASGVSANRLDSVLAFNALAISAGRRLAGWCCHGADGDPTIGPDPDEPLIEWRILSTLIDHGLNEFEWLEFLSPQQNFIGHALCVLAWPIHGWTHVEAENLMSQRSKKMSGTFSGFSSRGAGSQRYRRRSSSPLGKNTLISQLPPAPFGSALRRQACLLLINLWSLGAFTSHHILRPNSCGNAISSSKIWDPRPGSQRSHSYTATMEGGDLRRIMLKTISFRSEQMQMTPLEFLQRWSYFQAVWRSALSGTPLPESLNFNATSKPHQCWRHQSPQLPAYPMDHLVQTPSSSTNRNSRTYQPICLKLLTRRAVRSYIARAEMARRQGSSIASTPVLAIPILQRFLGYFHSLEHMMGAPLPKALQILFTATTPVAGEEPDVVQFRDENH